MQLISTIKERCRVCYTCVRDCPAKAIRISGGQAEVIGERCIGCGNCVMVCSQNAKQYHHSLNEVETLLQSSSKVAAILAPSFPADFPDMDYQQLVGLIRQLGFDMVCEVAFGADLVARSYRRRIENLENDKCIATTCPAVVSYVQKYHPGLVSYLAPIVSPMMAMGRVLHEVHGAELKVVFIGPCFAKKNEAIREGHRSDIDAVLSFSELREMFVTNQLDQHRVAPSDFDPPHAGLGALFPISRGMIQAAGMNYDLLTYDVIAAEGKSKFTHALKEFENDAFNPRMLEACAATVVLWVPE
jgi:iron only hydrogenase large subunit-like protein